MTHPKRCSADDVLRLIDERGYATEYLTSGKVVHMVGIAISSETGTVNGWKVEGRMKIKTRSYA